MPVVAFVFPGQGAQSVGMGIGLAEEFPCARAVLDEIDAALAYSLSTLMRDGPKDALDLTVNTQPALLAASLAAMAVLEEECGIAVERGRFVAGHSCGEYSALAAANAVSLADSARLLRRRGQAMQEAAAVGTGAMAALLGADAQTAQDAAAAGREIGICDVANDNCPGQIVLSGAVDAVSRAVLTARKSGVRRAIMLPVSAPFHSAMMGPARDDMAEALETITIASPSVPLISNATARPETDPEHLKQYLVTQMTAPVRWRESVAWMAAPDDGNTNGGGIDCFIEVGAGKTLTAMNRRTAPHAKAVALTSPSDLKAIAVLLSDSGKNAETAP